MYLLSGVKIKTLFPKHTKPTLKNFILLMNCIIQCRTVCLYKCRDKVQQFKPGKDREIDSNYARLLRFFKMKNIAEFISGIRGMMLAVAEADLTYLVVDRSNWKRGEKNTNLLTLGYLMSGILAFVPLYWVQLDKRGNSNIDDRKNLIDGFIELLAKSAKTVKGSILLADREFIGQYWFEYLLDKKISFVIRLREKMYFDLQTYTGKKNFIKDLSQIYRTLWHIQHPNEFGRYYLHVCND